MFKRDSPDWKRRIPTYKARTRGRIRAAIIVLSTLVWMFAGFYINDVRVLIAISIVWVISVVLMGLTRVTPLNKFIFDEIAPLEEVAGGDIPVEVIYLLNGTQLGSDKGYLGIRNEGLSFSGTESAFLLDPEPDDMKSFLSRYETPMVSVLLNDVRHNYVIQILPYQSLAGRKALDAAVELKQYLCSDRSEAPSTSIHNPPPLTASSKSVFRTLSDLYQWYAVAAVLPGLAVLFLTWVWAYTDHIEATRGVPLNNVRIVSIIGGILFLIIVGLLVVAFRETIPTLLRRYHVFLKLDKEALTRNTNPQ